MKSGKWHCPLHHVVVRQTHINNAHMRWHDSIEVHCLNTLVHKVVSCEEFVKLSAGYFIFTVESHIKITYNICRLSEGHKLS